MINTDKEICRAIASLLVSYGVEDVVLCPGSRNVPLVMAVSRHPLLNHTVVIDERNAAFYALGVASVTRRPTAVVCTSGTAMLNCLPALAEALYRHVPVVLISADRPLHRVNQDDSQTITQAGAAGAVVKMSVVVSDDCDSATKRMYMRRLNEALMCATSLPTGPVHINVHLDVPLNGETNVADDEYFPRIKRLLPTETFATAVIRDLAAELLPPKRVAVFCGFMPPDGRLNRALARLVSLPNVVVLADAQANVHARGVIGNIDALVAALTPQEKEAMAPDYVLSIGGAPLSALLKDWLRKLPNVKHWYIGDESRLIDCYDHIDLQVFSDAAQFCTLLSGSMAVAHKKSIASNEGRCYARLWEQISNRCADICSESVEDMPWCDFKAMSMLVPLLSSKTNLQVSNGLAIRYLQTTNYSHLHRIDGNRGVSGIDGSTSTAIGAAVAYNGGNTVLITGDMSAQYDMGALAMNDIPADFRMVVLDNNGGEIFRAIANTRNVAECGECLSVRTRFPLETLAKAYNFIFVNVENQQDLMRAAVMINSKHTHPVLVRIASASGVSAEQYRILFHRLKHSHKK